MSRFVFLNIVSCEAAWAVPHFHAKTLSRSLPRRAHDQKIHAVVGAQGLPIRLGMTAGQAHDRQIADTLLDHLGPRTIVLRDKA